MEFLAMRGGQVDNAAYGHELEDLGCSICYRLSQPIAHIIISLGGEGKGSRAGGCW